MSVQNKIDQSNSLEICCSIVALSTLLSLLITTVAEIGPFFEGTSKHSSHEAAAGLGTRTAPNSGQSDELIQAIWRKLCYQGDILYILLNVMWASNAGHNGGAKEFSQRVSLLFLMRFSLISDRTGTSNAQ